MCNGSITVPQATIIESAVVVQHSLIGCAARQAFTSHNYHDLYARRGLKKEDSRSICTNLKKEDGVLAASGSWSNPLGILGIAICLKLFAFPHRARPESLAMMFITALSVAKSASVRSQSRRFDLVNP
jgi:hypothetical protein